MTDGLSGSADIEFSVLVAAYNAEATIGATLDSLLGQDSRNWEAVVVDDGSTDRTAAIAEGYARGEGRIRLIRQSTAGTGSARNAAAMDAHGRWLLPLDADDLLLPEALSAQHEFIARNPGFDLYSWSSRLLLPDGSQQPLGDLLECERETTFTFEEMVESNRLLSFTSISASVFARVGGYRDVYVEDYDLWLRVMAAGAIHLHNPRLLALYRYRADSKNRDTNRSLLATAQVLKDLTETPGLSHRVARRAAARSAWYRGLVAKSQLEKSLADRRFAGARRAYWQARKAYERPLNRWVGLLLVMINPRLLAAALGTWRHQR